MSTTALGMSACTSTEAPGEPSVGASLTQATAKGYTAIDLGTLSGFSRATAINAAGQVVGETEAPGSSVTHAFLWDKGVLTDLGPGIASGISPSGLVVGKTLNGHACFWENGVRTELATLGGTFSEALAINAGGDIAGWNDAHAVVWHGRMPTDLGLGRATGINAAGEVAGHQAGHALLWGKDGVARDLGTLGGDESIATGINARGQVVGWSQVPAAGEDEPEPLHAFVREKGVMTDLGTLANCCSSVTSVAAGINSAGQIVGWSDTQDGFTHAFLWDNGAMTDLGGLGGTFSRAEAINAAGQVVGLSSTAEGEAHATLWTRR